MASSPDASVLIAPALWRRMACWLYEGMLLFGVVFATAWLFSTLTQMRNPMDQRLRPMFLACLFSVIGLYFAWFWSKGQTLAMKTWRIRIVDQAGHPITPIRAVGRYLLSWVWFFPPLAVIAPFKLSGGEIAILVFGWVWIWALLSRFHPLHQFWHDAWAGTRLIPSDPLSR